MYRICSPYQHFIGSHMFLIWLFLRLYGGAAYIPFCWAEWCLASIFALNALYHVSRYAWTSLTIRPILLSPKQRRLLGVADDDPLFKNQITLSQKASEPTTPLNLSCISLNRLNRMTSLGSSGLSESSTVNCFFHSMRTGVLKKLDKVRAERNLNILFSRGLFSVVPVLQVRLQSNVTEISVEP